MHFIFMSFLTLIGMLAKSEKAKLKNTECFVFNRNVLLCKL